MSGSTIGGVVGGIVGFFFGNPQLGFMIGSAIGGYVDPVKVEGPRLKDAAQQTSNDGVPIPFGYGTFPVKGNVIWTDELKEHKKTERQGKGGPKVTSYTYTRSYAIGICEGPIAGLLMIKRNGKVVYDARTEADRPDLIPVPSAEGGGLARAVIRRAIILANAARQGFLGKAKIYLGTEEQMPDPTMESVLGAGKVPAHRGLAYIVVKDEDLTETGGAIPQFEFVVAMEGEWGDTDASAAEPARTAGFVNAEWPLEGAESDYTYTGHWTAADGGGTQTPEFGTIAEVQAYIAARSAVDGGPGANALGTPSTYIGYVGRSGVVAVDGAGSFAFSTVADQHDVSGLESLTLLYQWLVPTEWQDVGADSFCPLIPNGSGWIGARNGIVVRRTLTPSANHYGFRNCDTIGETGVVEGIFPLSIQVKRKRAAPLGIPVGAVAIPDAPGFYVGANGEVSVDRTFTLTPGDYKFMSLSVIDGSHPEMSYTRFEQGPVRAVGDAEYNDEDFWTAAYEAAVAAGTMPAGMVYSATGTEGLNSYPMYASSAWKASVGAETLAPDAVPLASIVADLLQREGLTADDYDVSDLTGLVAGYRVASEAGADAMIAPLMQGFFFDATEYDGKIRFRKRGGDSEFVLGPDDYLDMDGDAVTETTVQEAELLRRVTVGYLDPMTEWTPTTQKYERRSGTVEARGEASTEIPIVCSGTFAAQVAEKRVKVAWSEPRRQEFGVPALKWARLTPADVGTLYKRDGSFVRVRIMSREEDSGRLLIESSQDSQAAYIGTVTGVAPPPPPLIDPPLLGPTQIAVMDLPALHEDHDRLGVYVAAGGLLRGWNGAEIQLSTDGGVTFEPYAQVERESTIGATTTALAAGSAEWPTAQTLTVRLPAGPESVTFELLQRYRNRAALLLDDGSWEVLQFQTVTPNSDGTYTLSGLVRGRYATSAGAASAGARFVLLDESVQFVPAESWALTADMLVRAVSYGTDPDAAQAVPVTFAGQSAREWPPHYVRAKRSGGDVIVTWIGRGRIGAETVARNSQWFTGYRVTFSDGHTADVTGTTYTYAAAPDPVTVSVAALNSITGAGPSSEAATA